jgi:hypothetical protein
MSRGWKKIHMMRQMTHLSYPLTHNWPPLLLTSTEEHANPICQNLQDTARPNHVNPPLLIYGSKFIQVGWQTQSMTLTSPVQNLHMGLNAWKWPALL